MSVITWIHAPRLTWSAGRWVTQRQMSRRLWRLPTKEEVYARAEQQMRRGKQLVISGFIVAVVGIVAYCVVGFTAGVNPELGSALLESPGLLVGPTLGIIGLGTLLWLVGSFVYLNGVMDSDPNGPDLDL